MRLLSFLLLLATASIAAAAAPVTAKELSLMFRSGSSALVIGQELQRRGFAGAIDPASEKMLTEAGAPAGLLEAIKRSSFAASVADAAREPDRTFDTLQKAHLPLPSAPAVSQASPATPSGDIVAGKRPYTTEQQWVIEQITRDIAEIIFFTKDGEV